MNEYVENIKQDRIKDQKILIELETQNQYLSKQVDSTANSNYENMSKLRLMDNETANAKIEVHFLFYLETNEKLQEFSTRNTQ